MNIVWLYAFLFGSVGAFAYFVALPWDQQVLKNLKKLRESLPEPFYEIFLVSYCMIGGILAMALQAPYEEVLPFQAFLSGFYWPLLARAYERIKIKLPGRDNIEN